MIETSPLTVERLRHLLDYDPETGRFVWRNPESKKARLLRGKEAGCLHKAYGYWVIRIDGRLYRRARLAWLWMHSQWPELEVDHRNGVRTDDRISNLRLATSSQQNANTARPRDNSSGFKGVSWHAKDKRWRARLANKWLGNFRTREEAFAAYKHALNERYGEYARFE